MYYKNIIKKDPFYEKGLFEIKSIDV